MDKEKRFRRTNNSIDNDIISATKEVIEEVGFTRATLSAIISKANVEPHTFYRRFENLEFLLDHFTRKYDFWSKNIILDDKGQESQESFYRSRIEKIIHLLYEDKTMQQILTWEISDDNETTRRIGKLREESAEETMAQLSLLFSQTGINIRIFTAILIGGIYHLILRRERSTFCGIDFSTSEGKQELLTTADNLIKHLFDLLPSVTK